jgi:hypothetical protein
MYKWFPGTNGSLVLMVPMYKWFPDTNGSQVQMVPRYKWFPGTNGSQYQNITGENQNINWTHLGFNYHKRRHSGRNGLKNAKLIGHHHKITMPPKFHLFL